jgi:hypothetical protein
MGSSRRQKVLTFPSFPHNRRLFMNPRPRAASSFPLPRGERQREGSVHLLPSWFLVPMYVPSQTKLPTNRVSSTRHRPSPSPPLAARVGERWPFTRFPVDSWSQSMCQAEEGSPPTRAGSSRDCLERLPSIFEKSKTGDLWCLLVSFGSLSDCPFGWAHPLRPFPPHGNRRSRD